MEKDYQENAPIISGTFQLSENIRKEDIRKAKKEDRLDQESEYYARQFMED